MAKDQIPDIVIGRLPVYLRSLQRMASENRKVTSSQEMGERLGISAAQIRKDLSQFGEFGKQGTGYNIEFLIDKIRHILRIDHDWDVVVIGAGDIGSAVARYKGFIDRGFRVTMIFDDDPRNNWDARGTIPGFRQRRHGTIDSSSQSEDCDDRRTCPGCTERSRSIGKGWNICHPELCADQPECPA